MTQSELNEYLLRYIANANRTKGAIMLTGDWGTGKSYYIQNKLEKYLQDKGYSCVTVSLYGLNTIKEIQRKILLENTFHISEHTKATKAGAIIGKTVLAGLNLAGVSIDLSKENITDDIVGINFNNKLLVLEDVERCCADITSILGLVNNLVDEDDVRVLLVANEGEILKSNATDAYRSIKEKTISDTLLFQCEVDEILKQIILDFGDEKLSAFTQPEKIKIIAEIMRQYSCYNLRTFIYACQKTVDVFHYMGAIDYSTDYLDIIFYGIINYTIRLKKGDSERKADTGTSKWDDINIQKFAPRKICVKYINEQIICEEDIANDYELFESEKNSLHHVTQDDDIRVLYSYYLQSEEKLKNAVRGIAIKLRNRDFCPATEYANIAKYLVTVNQLFDILIEDAIKAMESNLAGLEAEQSIDFNWAKILYSGEDEAFNRAYSDVISRFEKSYKTSDIIEDKFGYDPSKLELLHSFVDEHSGFFESKEGFAKEIDIPRFIEMYHVCNAEQMQTCRDIFQKIYSPINIGAFYSGDYENLVEIKAGIESLTNSDHLDKVQKQHCKWFINVLNGVIDKLKPDVVE